MVLAVDVVSISTVLNAYPCLTLFPVVSIQVYLGSNNYVSFKDSTRDRSHFK